MKKYLLAALIILITACSPQTAEPTPTATIVPTATYTPTPEPTSTPTITPTPTPEPMTMERLENMTDEDKFDLVPEEVEGERVLVSEYSPSVVVLKIPNDNGDGTKLVGYDLLKKEVVTLSSVGIKVISNLNESMLSEYLWFNLNVKSNISNVTRTVVDTFDPADFQTVSDFEMALRENQNLKNSMRKFWSDMGASPGGAFVASLSQFGGPDRRTTFGWGTFNSEGPNLKYIMITSKDPQTGEYIANFVLLTATDEEFNTFLIALNK